MPVANLLIDVFITHISHRRKYKEYSQSISPRISKLWRESDLIMDENDTQSFVSIHRFCQLTVTNRIHSTLIVWFSKFSNRCKDFSSRDSSLGFHLHPFSATPYLLVLTRRCADVPKSQLKFLQYKV